MMMITRTQSHIEFGLGEAKSVSIDISRISNAMLSADRMPCGRVSHALVLYSGAGSDPVRIEGELIELAQLHCYVVESMGQTEAECVARARLN